jgi:hypothetical protein
MKLLKYLIIFKTTKDPLLAAQIYQMIYHPEIKQSIINITNEPILKFSDKPIVETPKSVDKKEELKKSLEYLKSKKNPTKQDKDSIYTIEMVLKNMK